MPCEKKSDCSCASAARTVQTGQTVKQTGREVKFQFQKIFCCRPEHHQSQEDQSAKINSFFQMWILGLSNFFRLSCHENL